jgi:hypothetical protein
VPKLCCAFFVWHCRTDFPDGSCSPSSRDLGASGHSREKRIELRGRNGAPRPQLAAPLDNTTDFYSALYNSPFSTRWFVITFGTDSSLVVTPGWDNVTGVGTPNGAAFVNAIAP